MQEPAKGRFNREWVAVGALLIVAFLGRLAFFGNQGYAGVDTVDFSAWFQTAAAHGPRLFYSVTWSDYPPFNIYFFYVFGLLAQKLALFGTAAFTYIMKLPANIFDLGTAALIFAFVRSRLNFRWSMAAAALYAFNPAVVFDAAVWGQFDAIYAFFLILSLLLVFRSKPKWAVVAFMLGVLLKPQSIALAPLFFYLVWRKADWKGFAASILVAAAAVFAVILPFEWPGGNPVTFLTKIYIGAYGTYNYTSLNAFNIWAFQGMWVKDTTFTFAAGWAMFAAACALAIWLVHKRIDTDKELVILFAAFLCFFAFFMLPTRIHERYLFPAFGMLALMFPFIKRSRSLYVVLTATCFVNQYVVLNALNAAYPYAADLTGNPATWVVSLINLLTFVYVLILIVGELRGKSWLLQRQQAAPVELTDLEKEAEQA